MYRFNLSYNISFSKVYRFSFPYTQELDSYTYSNMDVHRFLSYFPSWSSAYKNFYSLASKTLSPVIESLSFCIDEMDTFMEHHYSVDGDVHFGYRLMDYEIHSPSYPSTIKTEFGMCGLLGAKDFQSIESTPIKALRLTEEVDVSRKQVDIGYSHTDNIYLDSPMNIFVRANSSTRQAPLTVIIQGYNENGFVEEIATSYSAAPVETQNKYQIITFVETNKEDAILSSYLDLEECTSYESETSLPKRITKEDGEYFDPLFSIDGSMLYVFNGNSQARQEHYSFAFNENIEKAFVTNLLDIIYLQNGSLYSAKLQLNYYKYNDLNSTTNNNNYLYLMSNGVAVNNDINAVIDVQRIKNELGSKGMRVTISNKESRLYLDKSGSFVSEAQPYNSWIDLSASHPKVNFSIHVENIDPYVIQVETDNGHTFQAMSSHNELKSFKLLDNVDDIFVANKSLYIRTNNRTFIAEPIRLAFTVSQNKIHLFNKFNNIEFYYG